MKKFFGYFFFIVSYHYFSQNTLTKRDFAINSVSFVKNNKIPFTSFLINDINQVLLPIDGGIYIPKDSIWFLPPKEGYYFTSVAYNIRDTAFFAVSNSGDSSKIFYLKSCKNGPIQKTVLLTLNFGIYNLIFTNNACFIWGYEKENSKIGVLTMGDVKWLLNIKGYIGQVHVTNTGDIYFSLENSIYKLNNYSRQLELKENISGFDIMDDGKFVLSCSKGICIEVNDKLEIIVPKLQGLIMCKEDIIYILPPKGKTLFKISEAK